MAKQRLGPPDVGSGRMLAAQARNGCDEVVAIGARLWPYQRVLRVACVLSLTAVVSLAAPGCSKDESSGDVATSTAVTTSTTAATTTTTSVEDAVLSGYRAFWAAYLRAGDPMNPEHPDLVATAINPELEQVQRAFLARLAGGEVIRGSIENNPASRALRPPTPPPSSTTPAWLTPPLAPSSR